MLAMAYKLLIQYGLPLAIKFGAPYAANLLFQIGFLGIGNWLKTTWPDLASKLEKMVEDLTHPNPAATRTEKREHKKVVTKRLQERMRGSLGMPTPGDTKGLD